MLLQNICQQSYCVYWGATCCPGPLICPRDLKLSGLQGEHLQSRHPLFKGRPQVGGAALSPRLSAAPRREPLLHSSLSQSQTMFTVPSGKRFHASHFPSLLCKKTTLRFYPYMWDAGILTTKLYYAPSIFSWLELMTPCRSHFRKSFPTLCCYIFLSESLHTWETASLWCWVGRMKEMAGVLPAWRLKETLLPCLCQALQRASQELQPRADAPTRIAIAFM